MEGSTIARFLLLLGTPTAIFTAILAGYLLATFWRRPTQNRTTQHPTNNPDSNMTGPRRSDSQSECPICIDPPKYAIETNCGHIFCANCFIQNWQTNFTTSPVPCPFCRQEVTLLIPCLSEGERNTTETEEVEERDRVMGEVGQYNRMHSDYPRSIYSQLQDLPILLRHIWRELFTWRGVEMLSRFRVLVCLVTGVLYAIAPIDLIPEAFLGIIGLLDDVVVMAVLLIQVSAVYRSIVANRDW